MTYCWTFNSDAAVDKVEDHISDALGKGATLLSGGKKHSLGGKFFELRF